MPFTFDFSLFMFFSKLLFMNRTTILLASMLIAACCAFTSQAQDNLYHEHYRGQYHFSQRQGWISDPCGFLYYEGKFHCYWWGCAESEDLVHWDEQNNHSQLDVPHGKQCWTGCVVADVGNTAGFGEGKYISCLTHNDPAAKLKSAGLEIIGANFTATAIELLEGKDNVTENTVWTGYFWMDEWSTLELSKASFNNVDWSEVEAIRFYSEAGRTDYVINVLTKWGDGGKLGDQTTMTMTNDYAELSLVGIDMAAALADVDRLMIQCNKEGGAPFNFTSIELVKRGEAGIGAIVNCESSNRRSYDLAGRKATDNHGLVIVGGKVRKY